jgi:tetratricopeptide (TPR) repeat protein
MLLVSTKIWAAEVVGRVSLQGETFNFELSGQKNWDYDIKRIKEKNVSKIQLSVKPLEQASIEQIKNIENPFVKSIKVSQKSTDGKMLIEFILKDEQTETFDYLTDQPSKLIVDFYQAEALESDLKAPVKLDKPEKKIEAQKAKKNTAKKENLSNKKREPADVDFLRIDEPGGIETSIISKAGLYDGGDSQFSRFLMRENEYNEESIIRSESNYYLKFPILESDFSFWKKMKENPPLYEMATQKDTENKEARLLKTLFNKKRYFVFKKTYDWFEKKYPQSKYLEMLTFMMGDVLIELYKEEKVDAIYEQALATYMKALEKYPQSALAERTSLMTGMLAIEKSDYMSAIRKLNLHADNKNYKSKISRQYAQIGIAYSLSQLNKLDDALAVLNQIEKESKDPLVLASTAAYRGDFYFHAKKYDEAIATYDSSIKKYDIVASLFPSAFFNKMEAQFWRKKYKDSHLSALDFTKNFPTHAFAPYALTRVGELLDMMGADQAKSVGAFLETHFRYGDNPKTIVARLHLLSTRMKSMKLEELDETLKKMDTLAEYSQLENIDQFKTTMIADGFARRSDYKRAVAILSNFYQQNPSRPDSKQVTARIIRNINDDLKNLADKKEYKNLLKTYKEYADTWLKGQSRIDTDYLLGLAYENAGVYGVSIDKFTKTAERLNAIKGSPQEKIVRVNQYLPTTEGLELKIALNAFENKNFQQAYQTLEKIKNPLQLTEEEQVERIVLASKLYEQKGDTETSIRYLSELSRLWKGNPELALPAVTRLADMQTKQNLVQEAIATYKKSLDIMLKQEKPELRILSQVSRAYLDLLNKQNQGDEAKAMLTQIVQKLDPKLKLSEQKYQLGLLYFKSGEIKKAQQTWETITDSEDGIWKKLAQEKLQQSGWDESYKKHIKRIPAMSKLEGAK